MQLSYDELVLSRGGVEYETARIGGWSGFVRGGGVFSGNAGLGGEVGAED